MELRIHIPDSIEPLERGERFELPLIDMLEPIGGDILGSGTHLVENKILSCDIDIEVPDERFIPQVVEILVNGRIPKGSTISQRTGLGVWKVIREF